MRVLIAASILLLLQLASSVDRYRLYGELSRAREAMTQAAQFNDKLIKLHLQCVEENASLSRRVFGHRTR